jgi:catalase
MPSCVVPPWYRHNGNQPVYAPNNYGGPSADLQLHRDPSWMVEAGEIMRTAYEPHQDDDDFIQPSDDADDREHLVTNIVA